MTEGSENHNFKTHLFECKRVVHERVYYDSIDQFIELYNEKTANIDGHIIGVPDYFWKKDPPKEPGYFLFVQYYNDEKTKFLVIKNATTYITSKGQTVEIVQ